MRDGRLTTSVRDAVNRGDSSIWFMLRGTQSASAWTYKTVNGELWLTLNRNASVATLQAPANGAIEQKVEPPLSASATDPDGDQVHYYFRVSENPNPDVQPVWNTPGGRTRAPRC
ncbi:hypothetical protein HJG43_14110 [Kineosporiaceae bacterium SCSIO 59966]|nr:hypothetical protein HJG43_14110 [Kineosporiaceae bacterium SCSIO 59966]